MSDPIVIIGAGQAAAAFAGKLRALGSDRPVTIVKLTPPVKPAAKPQTELLSDRSLASIKAEVLSDAPTGRSASRPVAAQPEAVKLETAAAKPADASSNK